MYAVVMRICRVTTDVCGRIMVWMKDDEDVSDAAKHPRHARQDIGARRRSDLLSITRKFHLRRHFFFFVCGHVRRSDEYLEG